MRSPTRSLKTYSGAFESIRLAFTPDPPLPQTELSRTSANYPTELAKLHVYLDSVDVTELLPSAYMLWLLGDLLRGLAELVTDQATTVVAQWWSDPWRFDLRGDLVRNRVHITLQVPGRWVAMQDVNVPLDGFGKEVLRVGQEWRAYLDSIFHQELTQPELSEQISRYDDWLQRAQEAFKEYKTD